MASDWEVVKLKNAAKFFSGGTPPKSQPEYWGGDIPWISAKSMKGSRYHDSDLKLTEAGLKKGSRLAPKNSILLLVRGSMLHQKIPVGIATKDVAFNQDVKAIVPNEKFLPLYFYYCFAGREHELLSKVENTGIGAGKLDTDVLNKVEFYCPPIQEQKVIANFLGSLDDKIELNRQMNETLEAMAQTLFKSWFVDFDPVIDNALAAGKPIPDELLDRAELRQAIEKKDNSDIQDLFPDEFEFTEEMGWIPKGWENGTLADICFFGTGKINTSELSLENYVSTENMNKEKSGISYAASIASTNQVPKFSVGQTLISNIRPYFKKIWLASFNGGRSNDVLGFQAHNSVANEYLFNLLYQDSFFDYMTATSKGTKMPRGDKAAIMSWSVAIPSPTLMGEFSKKVKPIYLANNLRSLQSLELAKLRDNLLPKLMSGELRLDKVEILDKL